MDNVISLHRQKDKVFDPKVDFKTTLNTPLNLGLPEPQEQSPKPPAFSTMKWKLSRFKKHIIKRFIRPVRDYFYRKESNRLLGHLIRLAMKLNRDDFHAFVNVSGHTSHIMVYVYPGGWKKSEKTILLEGCLPGWSEYAKMRPGDIRETMRMMKSLSNLAHLKR